ncbi:MAG: hypothetical protein ACR2N7_05385 [Acidimicrobiia bacterium]
MVFYISNAAAIAAMDAVVDLIDVGSTNAEGRVKIYAGTVPADADAAIGGATLLATLNMSNPAFGNSADAAPGATATANSITDDSSADATGTAAFFRIWDRNENTVIQGLVTVTAGGGDLELNSISITSGAAVSITSMTKTMPES